MLFCIQIHRTTINENGDNIICFRIRDNAIYGEKKFISINNLRT